MHGCLFFRLDCSFHLPIRSRLGPHAEAPIGDRSIRTFRRRKMALLVRCNTPPRRLGIGLARTLCALLLLAALGKNTLAQGPEPQHPHVVTPLSDLLQEAEKNNPQIAAARKGWTAA